MAKFKKMHETIFLKGTKVFLRPLAAADINTTYLSWLNDPEVTRFIETGRFPTTQKQLADFYKATNLSKTDFMFAILDAKTKRHIGNIRLGGINWIHRHADLGIMIGEKKCWGKGCGQEACRLLLDYAFNRLNLNKVILGVYSNHFSAMKTYQKIGFRIEGRIKNFLHFEGAYVDKIIMGISCKEFKARHTT